MHLLECIPLLIFQKGPTEINFLDRFQTLHLSWSGFIFQDDYFFIMEQLFQFTLQYNACNWLIDARDADWTEIGDPEWIGKFCNDKVKKCGLRKMGRLASGNFYYEINLSEQFTQLEKSGDIPFEFKYFQDINAALAWFCQTGKLSNN